MPTSSEALETKHEMTWDLRIMEIEPIQNIQQSTFYPISLDDIKSRVAKKKHRRNGFSNGYAVQVNWFDDQPLDNVKEIVNEFGEKILRVDGDIQVNLNVKNGGRFLFISYDQSILTHGLHKYPAKFFPELPRWIIRRFSKENDLILDPFLGREQRLLKHAY